jgi:sugar phosphate isomerase/epimerase
MLIGGRAHSLKDINYVGEARLDFAEINLLNPHHPFQEIPFLLKLKKVFNFFFIVHGPEEGNPFDCQELRNKLLPQIKILVDFAYELDASLITIHFWLDQRFIGKTILMNKLTILEDMMNLATKKRITLCLENLSERIDDLEQTFHQFPQIGLTLDIGHGELLTSKNTAYSFIEMYPDRIKHIHIHDNYGGNTPDDDLHLPLGKGTVVFEPILHALCETGYNGTITLEVAPQFLKQGKEKLERMLNTFNTHKYQHPD